jgi:hypothetical protein
MKATSLFVSRPFICKLVKFMKWIQSRRSNDDRVLMENVKRFAVR